MKLYLSHSIRGSAGSNASHDIQAANCAEAIKIADEIRLELPKLELYVPAENETFVQIAYECKYISEKEILDVDCKIIDTCSGVIIYVPKGDALQGGRLVEYRYATAIYKPVFLFSTVAQVIEQLRTAHWCGDLL